MNTLTCYIVIYIIIQHHNDTISKTDAWKIKTQEGRCMKENAESFFTNIFTSLFTCKVRKGCSRFTCERVLETEHNLHILTPLLWPSRCVFLVLLMFNRRPRAHSAGCWLSLWHLISIFSGPQISSGVSEGLLGRVWLSLPHLVSSCLDSTGNCFGTSNSTELNNNSTPTRSNV